MTRREVALYFRPRLTTACTRPSARDFGDGRRVPRRALGLRLACARGGRYLRHPGGEVYCVHHSPKYPRPTDSRTKKKEYLVMRRNPYLPALLCAVVAAALLVTPARVRAITYGFVDVNNAYPNVGAFIVQSPSGEIYPFCSGTLIAPDVFLTASHCTAYYTNVLEPQGYTAYVSFDSPIGYGTQTSRKTKLLAVA